MDWLRQWLQGVIACAMLVSLAMQLCPEGSVRKTLRFTGALLLLLALLGPLSKAELPEELLPAGEYREALARLEPELRRTREEALSSGIAAELEAYIEDKAGRLGTPLRAEVTLTWQDEAAIPERITLRGAYSEEVSALIAAELGIPKERQEWIDNR